MAAKASPCERFPLRTKPSDLRVASLAGTTRCTISTKKFGPPRSEKLGAVRIAPSADRRGIGSLSLATARFRQGCSGELYPKEHR